MQSLWSRAGQAHRCGCRACSTAVGAVGRRAAAGARRKPTFAEIFTACYSSVFATAALVDAVRKDDRRRELDRQIEETRKELSDLREQARSTSASNSPQPTELSPQQMDTLWKSLKTIYINRPYMKEIDKPAMACSSELVSSLKAEYYNSPTDAALQASRRTNYEQLERAIMAEERDSTVAFREPRNKLQLLNESSSIEHLVQQFLRRAEILDESSEACPSFEEARGLAQKGYPNFTYRSINPKSASKNTLTLNKRLRSLVGNDELGLKEKIGRVCYNLLVSAHPPDMHTYNTLIVAFDKSGQHTFSDALVHSFFHQRLLKPTASTFSAILNHYKMTNNHGKFLRGLACITGLDTLTGSKLGRRHVNDVQLSPQLRKWAADTTLRTRTGDYVWEHVPLNLPLVESILTGLVHFKLFDDAASFFITCMRSGVEVSTRVVIQVFDECIAALDWRAAVRLVRGLSNSHKKWQRLLTLQDNTANAAYLVSRVIVLLDLCGLCSQGQSPSKQCLDNLDISRAKLNKLLASLANTNLILTDAQSGVLGAAITPDDTSLSLSTSRLLQIESLWKEYEFVRKTTASIESKLLYPEFGPIFRESMVQYIGNMAIQRSLNLTQELEGATWPSNTSSQWPQRKLRLDLPGHAQPDDQEGKIIKEEELRWQDHALPNMGEPLQGTAVACTSSIGYGRFQEGTAANGLPLRPRGLLTWARPGNRLVYPERRQWALEA